MNDSCPSGANVDGGRSSSTRKPRRPTRCETRLRIEFDPANQVAAEDFGERSLPSGVGAGDLARARRQKLASIRAAIAAGRYRISSQDLAQALINHMLRERSPKITSPKGPATEPSHDGAIFL